MHQPLVFCDGVGCGVRENGVVRRVAEWGAEWVEGGCERGGDLAAGWGA